MRVFVLDACMEKYTASSASASPSPKSMRVRVRVRVSKYLKYRIQYVTVLSAVMPSVVRGPSAVRGRL